MTSPLLNPSKSPPRAPVPRIATEKLSQGTPVKMVSQEMKSPQEEDSKMSDDEFGYAIHNDDERAAMKAKRKAAKKSKKRLNRLRSETDENVNSSSKPPSPDDGGDTGRSSQHLNVHRQ